ncbi:MAG TPA: right-handed parallel beta-helix repeat-containing protein [Bacteroidota bacterium]|nr:right-handed parallel beta-helix repeat-containing protein [Bacteroidota bacterium]
MTHRRHMHGNLLCLFASALLFTGYVLEARAQTTYYLAAEGNDTYDGRSAERPWQTIARLNAAMLAPGDIVCFHAGDVFMGMILAWVSDVTYESYEYEESRMLFASNEPRGISETGPVRHSKPVIAGSVPVKKWKRYRGSIYSARVEQQVGNVFANGVQMTLARFPNSGWLRVDATANGTTDIASSGVTQAAGYWQGGQIRIRSTNYTFETRPVESSEPGRLRLAGHANNYPNNFSYGVKAGFGFYLDNKLAALDAPGEWYYDNQSKMLYFYAPRGADPNSLTVEASVYPYGVQTSKSGLRIRDLEFRNQSLSALKFEGSTRDTKIESVSISGAMTHGIEVGGTSASYLIDRTTIDRVNGQGILLAHSTHTVVSRNRITRIGLVAGYGIDNEHGMSGVVLLGGSDNVLRANRIDSVGYIGIRSDGSHNRVEDNTITNVMLRLSDGGAIYAYNENGFTYGSIWKHNTIINAPGNVDGAPATQPEAHGLYWDFRCHDMTAEDNRIEQTTSSGLFMQYGCYNNTIRNNVIAHTGENPIHIITDRKYTYGGNTIKGNIFTSEGRMASMYLQFADADFHPIGELDSNYYSTTSDNPAVKRVYSSGGEWKSKDYSLRQWQELSKQDLHSQEIFRQPASFFFRMNPK